MVVPERCLWCQKSEEDARVIAELKLRIQELQARERDLSFKADLFMEAYNKFKARKKQDV